MIKTLTFIQKLSKTTILSAEHEYDKSRAWHAHILVCSRAWCTSVLTCSHDCFLGVLTYMTQFCAFVFGMFTCLRVYVLSMHALFVFLRAHMVYMLAVLKYLTCLHASLTFLYRKISFYSEKYLEPT